MNISKNYARVYFVMTSVEDAMKNISQVILLSTSCLFCLGVGNVYAYANVFKGVPKSGTHTNYTTHLADTHLSSARFGNQLRHLRVKAVRPGDADKNIEALFDLDVRIKSDNDVRVASVCFITDTGECSGEKFGNNETLENGGGNPNGGNWRPGEPALDNDEGCLELGYTKEPCPEGTMPKSYCPYDSSYHSKCECSSEYNQICTPPYYGEGKSCGGKYVSCRIDSGDSCKEAGYTQTVPCSSLQKPNDRCPYDSVYYDRCVCRSDLVTCTYPQTGVGEACDSKYVSCKCPDAYKSCDCGGAVGATSCTVNGVTTYSSCKECCVPLPSETNCPNGMEIADNGCGGNRVVCKGSAVIPPDDGGDSPDDEVTVLGEIIKSDGCMCSVSLINGSSRPIRHTIIFFKYSDGSEEEVERRSDYIDDLVFASEDECRSYIRSNNKCKSGTILWDTTQNNNNGSGFPGLGNLPPRG